MTTLFLDCEFTNFKGNLISMALVDEVGNEFYEVLYTHENDCHPWVVQNVLPILDKDPIPFDEFQRILSNFLNQYADIEVIADWPEDFYHFTMAILTGPGQMMNTPKLTMTLQRGLNYNSFVPHNALEDAKAIAIAYIKKQAGHDPYKYLKQLENFK